MANKEIGLTGLKEFHGRIFQDFMRELQFTGTDKGGYGVYEEMRLNSPVITALLNAITQAILSVDWMFASDDGEEDPRLDLLNDSENSMSHGLKHHFAEALTMLPFGYSLFEIVYQRVGGRVLWRKFAFRGQDTISQWDIDEHGGIDGVKQLTSKGQTATIPIKKLLLYRVNVERNNPEGRSILRGARIPYYYATHLQEIEAIGIERDLTGLPVLIYPEGADTSSGSDDRAEAEQIVRRVRNDEQAGITLPQGWEFRLEGSPGSKQIDVGGVISRYEKRILMSALAQFLVLGMDQIGALSLSEDQTDFFNMSVNATTDIISDTFTKHAIPRLMKMNGMDAEGLSLQHTPAGDINMTEWFDAMEAAGERITWTAEDEVVARSIAGLPEKTVEELKELMEAEEEKRMSMMEQLSQPGQQDDMGATEFPTDGQRTHRERKWRKSLRDFFNGERRRLLKASKNTYKK